MLLTEKRDYKLYVDIRQGEGEEESPRNLTELSFSNLELLHEIVMSSLPQQRLPGDDCQKRRYELAYRIYLLEMALEVQKDTLKKSGRIAHLDFSEKSLIHYYLGTALTKMIARRLFQTDYLTHLSAIRQADGRYLNSPGSNRNDMIGAKLTENGYRVWSVKGRSQNSRNAMKIGCREVCDFQAISGGKPEIQAVCMTYYDGGYLNAAVQIPGKSYLEKSRQVSVDFERKSYLRAYYQCVCQLFSKEGERQNYRRDKKFYEDGIVTEIPLFSGGEAEKNRVLRVGISRKLLSCVRDGENGLEDCIQQLCWQETLDREQYMGGDGIYIC